MKPRHFQVGEVVVVTPRNMQRMKDANACRVTGVTWLADGYLAEIRKVFEAGTPGVVTHTFPPGYEMTVDFEGQAFHMKDHHVTLVLGYNQDVFVEQWGRFHCFSVGSVEGYARQYEEDPAPEVERALANGHDLAWTHKHAAVLTTQKGYYERQEAKRQAATELVEGQEVMIEGRCYQVKLAGRDYSDGIKFVPVAD